LSPKKTTDDCAQNRSVSLVSGSKEINIAAESPNQNSHKANTKGTNVDVLK